MKSCLLALLCIVLVSCANRQQLNSEGEPLKIDPTRPPAGADLVRILLENQSLPLRGTECEDSGRSPDNRRLLHKLATNLGSELDNIRHRREISGGCEPDKYELPSGEAIAAWQCHLDTVTKNKKGEFIASSHIYFGIKQDTWELIRTPGALRCL